VTDGHLPFQLLDLILRDSCHLPASASNPVECFCAFCDCSRRASEYTHDLYPSSSFAETQKWTLKSVLPCPKKGPHTAFGKRLFTLRKTRSISQAQLAEALGTTQRVISHYETNAEVPQSSIIIPLARVLVVTTDELLGLRPGKSNGGDSSGEKQQLWKRFQRMEALPTNDQRAVIRLINSLAGTTHSEAT
jgi:transcriptional regulator with XRE-family HTH domain